MTTKNSPYAKLKAQADKIAAILKHPKARSQSKRPDAPTVNVGIVMDDKVIRIDMAWTLIAETEEAALAEYIMRQMQETDDGRAH